MTTIILLTDTCASGLEELQSLKKLILESIDQFKECCASLSTSKSAQDLQGSLWIEIQNRTPKVEHETQLPPKLKEFKVLSKCVKDVENGDDLRTIELAIQTNPKDTAAQKQLLEKAKSLMEKYAEEISGRVNSPELTRTVVEICHLGNNSFRKVYDTLWDEKIVSAEDLALQAYALLADAMKVLAKSAKIQKQPVSDLVELYVQAATVKPEFDRIMAEVEREFALRTEKDLTLSVCSTLKKTTRMAEKSQLKASEPGDVSGVKDIVRAMMTGRSMEEVNVVIEIMIKMHQDGKLEIVRVKDRFLEAPSSGGWRDIMVNICLTVGSVQHVAEIQIVHHSMLNARKGLDGHIVYNVVRNGLEMLAMRRGSIDVTALVDFENNVEQPRFAKWYSQAPAGEWEGVVSSNLQDHILEVDLASLDPKLEVRHRLSHLRKLAIPSTIPQLTATYIAQVTCFFYSLGVV